MKFLLKFKKSNININFKRFNWIFAAGIFKINQTRAFLVTKQFRCDSEYFDKSRRDATSWILGGKPRRDVESHLVFRRASLSDFVLPSWEVVEERNGFRKQGRREWGGGKMKTQKPTHHFKGSFYRNEERIRVENIHRGWNRSVLILYTALFWKCMYLSLVYVTWSWYFKKIFMLF